MKNSWTWICCCTVFSRLVVGVLSFSGELLFKLFVFIVPAFVYLNWKSKNGKPNEQCKNKKLNFEKSKGKTEKVMKKLQKQSIGDIGVRTLFIIVEHEIKKNEFKFLRVRRDG